ncbi:hypothetical protein IW261DRAFT_1567505 [Armillaria novae-zelandiae]|uniref:Uncharacterized protein n=1 Tax=Armillaria novae-zelandiae TaxID=153914 RepID=A0AA39P1Q3_9AGAR|nr:hypothetical protein IW261DRAFT_1567505 [Armillaria novae-zelandiae]
MQNLILVFLLTVGVSGAPGDSDSSDLPECSKELRRMELNIIWSCLATIFASTWLSVHPNVPGLDLTKEGSVWWIFDRPTIMCSLERVKLMVIAILAPKVMVGWAIRQFLVAMKVRVYSSKEHELKLVHGFFVSMGGFYYGKEERLVTLNDVPKLQESLAKVRAVDIKDKSKGYGLSKLIVVLQLSWFVVQCCARAARKLSITLLEMTALAFALLSIALYAAWWDKPVDVLYHIRLEESSSMDTNQDGCIPPTVTIPMDVDPEPTVALPPAKRSLDNPYKSLGAHSAYSMEILPLPNTASSEPTAGSSSGWPHNSPVIDTSTLKDNSSPPAPEVSAETSLLAFIQDTCDIFEHLGKRVMRPFTRICFSVMGFIFRDDIGSGVDRPVLTAATGAAGMSCCDGGTLTKDDDFSIRLEAVLYVGSLFGAIHCAAWSFSFPSYAEKVLWRTSSLAIILGLFTGISQFRLSLPERSATIPPLVASRLQWAQRVFEQSRISTFTNRFIIPRNLSRYTMLGNSFYHAVNNFGSVFWPVLAIMIYIIARVTLIVLVLLQLRSLPPSALCTVNWTTFIPHI